MNTRHISHMKQIMKLAPPLNKKELDLTKKVAPISKKQAPVKKYKKQTIPVALREQVWITACGRVFEHKCITPWCKNIITVFDFESGHDIPESKGGPTTLENLVPLCRRCNNSMGDRYTFAEWSRLTSNVPETIRAIVPIPFWKRFICFFKYGKTKA